MASEEEQIAKLLAGIIDLQAQYPGAQLTIVHMPARPRKSAMAGDMPRGTSEAVGAAHHIPGVKDNGGDVSRSALISAEDAASLFALSPKVVRRIARRFGVRAIKVRFDNGARNCYDRRELERALCAGNWWRQ